MFRLSCLLIIVCHLSLISAKTDQSSNNSLNDLSYEYHSEVTGEEAEFSFTLKNVSHIMRYFQIDSYYFSISFNEKERREVRMETVALPSNATDYTGELRMERLEEHGNYFVCVFFLGQNGKTLIGSSRFCHVISISGKCNLGESVETFDNRHAMIVGIIVVLFFLFVAIVSAVRKYIYRPKKIEAILKTLPQHHADNLEQLAGAIGVRRQRRPQPALGKRLREDSLPTLDYDPNVDRDHEFYNYHAYDNMSLDTLDEGSLDWAALPEYSWRICRESNRKTKFLSRLEWQ